MEHFQNMEQIRQEVNKAQGVLTVTMVDLKGAYNAINANKLTLRAIGKELQGMGLGYFPELSSNMQQQIRLYKIGSPVADLIESVLKPSQEHDDDLRQVINGGAEAILARIRELLG